MENKLDDTASAAFNDLKKSLEKIQLLSTQFLVLSGHQHPETSGEANADKINLKTVIDSFIENTREQQSRANTEFCNNVSDDVDIYFDSNLIFEFLQLVVQETLDAALEYAKFNFSNESDEEENPTFTISIESDISLPPDIEEFIFEPFAMPAANVGSGLSFSVAKNLIERNGGHVEAKVPDSNHLSFTITFLQKA